MAEEQRVVNMVASSVFYGCEALKEVVWREEVWPAGGVVGEEEEEGDSLKPHFGLGNSQEGATLLPTSHTPPTCVRV